VTGGQAELGWTRASGPVQRGLVPTWEGQACLQHHPALHVVPEEGRCASWGPLLSRGWAPQMAEGRRSQNPPTGVTSVCLLI